MNQTALKQLPDTKKDPLNLPNNYFYFNNRVMHLGIDLSTQSLSLIAIDDNLNIQYQYNINYTTTFPIYNTIGGVHCKEDGSVTSPVLMWIQALDVLFSQMVDDTFPFHDVLSVSGSGQQHGSVFWNDKASMVLSEMEDDRSFYDQLKDVFSVYDCPVWMDSSTSDICKEMEDFFSPSVVSAWTGSVAYERFTFHQIVKIFRQSPLLYEQTERISLVSSFLCSLFAGQISPIDYSDGSGMNLMDISTHQWVPEILDFGPPNLASKLGEVVPSHSVIGNISAYLAKKYGFNPSCKVIAFSGDNPCSMAGLRVTEGTTAISLGTSDTIFASLKSPMPCEEGHILVSPIEEGDFMALLCYKNGSLTREDIRNKYANSSWEEFSKILSDTPPGNNGNIGFYYKEMEITPQDVIGYYYFNSDDEPCEFDGKTHARAIIEGTFLSMKLHCLKIGIQTETKILATGGASTNSEILQVLSDIFQRPIYVGSLPDSAAIGAAYRALHGLKCQEKDEFLPFESVLGDLQFTLAVSPNKTTIYEDMLLRYRQLEQTLLKHTAH